MLRATSLVLVVFSSFSQVRAVSTVQYTVELGGDNHAAAYKSGHAQTFTPGSTSPQTYTVGQIITWDSVVQAGGSLSSDNSPVYGMANIVFSLELHQGSPAGPLASTVGFLSTINNGLNGDPLEKGAFAYSYHVGGAGPARVIDDPASGGPNLGYFQYGSTAGFPPGSTALPGTLIGIGAGYPSFDDNAVAGVGMPLLPNGQPGLGVVPVAEGQMDTSSLPLGLYYLVLVPGSGTNLLTEQGYLNPGGAFAAAPDVVSGSVVSFMLVPEPVGAALLAYAGLLLGRRRTQ